MTRSEIIEEISRRTGKGKKDAETTLNLTLSLITDSLVSGEKVVIKNFGRFDVIDRKPTIKNNPRGGDSIHVNGHRSITFHASPFLRSVVNEEN